MEPVFHIPISVIPDSTLVRVFSFSGLQATSQVCKKWSLLAANNRAFILQEFCNKLLKQAGRSDIQRGVTPEVWLSQEGCKISVSFAAMLIAISHRSYEWERGGRRYEGLGHELQALSQIVNTLYQMHALKIKCSEMEGVSRDIFSLVECANRDIRAFCCSTLIRDKHIFPARRVGWYHTLQYDFELTSSQKFDRLVAISPLIKDGREKALHAMKILLQCSFEFEECSHYLSPVDRNFVQCELLFADFGSITNREHYICIFFAKEPWELCLSFIRSVYATPVYGHDKGMIYLKHTTAMIDNCRLVYRRIIDELIYPSQRSPEVKYRAIGRIISSFITQKGIESNPAHEVEEFLEGRSIEDKQESLKNIMRDLLWDQRCMNGTVDQFLMWFRKLSSEMVNSFGYYLVEVALLKFSSDDIRGSPLQCLAWDSQLLEKLDSGELSPDFKVAAAIANLMTDEGEKRRALDLIASKAPWHYRWFGL